MATVTGSGKDFLDQVWTYRYTYTVTNYANRQVITFTKVEAKMTNPFLGSYGTHDAGSILIQYKDSSHSNASASISFARFQEKSSYVTIWTGSKAITHYKEKTVTNVTMTEDISVSISVPAADSYDVTFSANGGTGAPGVLKKYYGYDEYLPSGTPTRTGYSFVNWLCSADSQYYSSYSKYTLNQGCTMTAQWSANSYYVTYNNNGGSGTIQNQTKVYDTAANFSSGSGFTKKEVVNSITREYELKSWNTNPDGSGTSYALGSSIPNITSNLTVYAIWELKYIYPYVNNVQSYRTATSSAADTTRADEGEYIYISFDFVGCSSNGGSSYSVPSCKITIDEDEYTPTLTFDAGTHEGSLAYKPNQTYSKDLPHYITIELYDANRTASKFTATDYITTAIFPIDLYANNSQNKAYMGVMHPYTAGLPLTVPDLFIDGLLRIHLDVDGNASKTTAAISGEDKDLFNQIRSRGWYDEVIDGDGRLLVKKLLGKILT